VIPAVFDCCVVASGLGWSGNPRFCLDLVFAQQVLLCVTTEVWNEYAEKIPVILAAKKRNVDAPAMLARLLRIARFVRPAPLGKQRSRDLQDDRYLACALAARAEAIVTSDRDLLALGKPFGVAVLTPVEFIKLVRAPGLT
jgi:putative PIN family toxin of toxin-antitoxin system